MKTTTKRLKGWIWMKNYVVHAHVTLSFHLSDKVSKNWGWKISFEPSSKNERKKRRWSVSNERSKSASPDFVVEISLSRCWYILTLDISFIHFSPIKCQTFFQSSSSSYCLNEKSNCLKSCTAYCGAQYGIATRRLEGMKKNHRLNVNSSQISTSSQH